MAHHFAPKKPLDPITYEQSVYEHGLHYERPPFTFDSTKWESLAIARMSAESTGYVHGSAGTGLTNRRNLESYKRYSLVPSRLVPSRKDDKGNELFPDLSTTILGQKIPYPIAMAPVGVLKIFHPSAESGAASAAASCKIPYIMSTASSTSIEDAAKANGSGLRWFQLYWPSNAHDDITLSILFRAKAAGFTALFVTLDTYVLGWRPSDMDNGYNPFLRADRIGVDIGFTDPVFQKHFESTHGEDIFSSSESEGKAAGEWTKTVFPGHSHSWSDLEFLKKHWSGPIVLKGIQTIADAKKAVEMGMSGIVVSNHGGRQTDGGPSSLSMLPKIVDAVGQKIDVLFDSGIRCGADVATAIALGAKCVLLGRPYVYGLALGGEEGVAHVLRAICGELTMNLHLSGITELGQLTRDKLLKDDEPL